VIGWRGADLRRAISGAVRVNDSLLQVAQSGKLAMTR
jgi:hypothetical protein